MSTLVVLAFQTESGAQDVLTVINDLQRQHLITLEDAATVVRGQDGKPKVKQATSLVGEGAWGGAFWGHVVRPASSLCPSWAWPSAPSPAR